MNNGWIKIHRKLLDWEWYGDFNMLRMWIHLLLNANFEEKKWMGIVIKRGQLVTSIKSLCDQTGLTAMQVRLCLDRLTKTGEINKQSNNQFTIITICKYDFYQSTDEDDNKQNNKRITNEQQTDNKQTTNEQQTDNKRITTTKEYKEREEREERKELQRIKENNTLTRISDRTQSFFDWLEINCPYVFGHLKLPTDAQYDTLVERYGKNMIAEQCMQIENRADLRKKYKVLFPTLNNWCKRELKSSNQAEYEQQQRLLQYAEVAADFLNQSEMGEQSTISPVIPF